ncbi:MAG: hypothetical protein DRJ64_07975 [Thermoprotei archaeon]|nr:MAG: hypothetical protein DRJ64_07975 [Thermoprotei archaeon]
MSPTKYAFINAKVRGMKGKLLTKMDIDSLIGADSFQTMVRLLEQSSYGPKLAELPFEEINSRSLDRIFSEDFIDSFSTIYRSSPLGVKEFLDEFCMKFEARALKTILRSKAADLEIREAMRYLIPVGHFTKQLCEELLREKDLRNIIEKIPVRIFRDALREKWRYYEETGNIFLLEIAVDQVAYEEIWKYIAKGKIKGKDKETAKKVIGTEIDTTNIKIVLRGKLLDIEPSLIQESLLKVSYRLKEDVIQRSLQVKSISEAVKILAVYPYEEALHKALRLYEEEKSLSVFETELDKFVYSISKRVSYGYPFQIGTLLCYLNLKWFEVKNLKTIVVGKEERVIPLHIRKYLVYES